ncbi:MAG: hypothetical protein HYX27_21555 [Acidobacteria bacterium]|nr:hypothetical protein [Acidobacteriota bacterium]
MADQSFKSHARWDPPFHFFLMPVIVGTFLFSVKHAWAYPNGMTIWLVLLCAGLFVWLVKTRMYALAVQDRLIRLEERLRMERVIPAELMARFDEFTKGQVIALRFASDGELTELARRALDEKLKPKEIKAAIQQWRPDLARI